MRSHALRMRHGRMQPDFEAGELLGEPPSPPGRPQPLSGRSRGSFSGERDAHAHARPGTRHLGAPARDAGGTHIDCICLPACLCEG